jgi:hypothetical protein
MSILSLRFTYTSWAILACVQACQKKEFILDYPNLEVRESLARHLLASYFESSIKASEICKRIQKALSDRDPESLVKEFNMLLSRIPYDYHKEKRDEFFYCSAIFTVLYAIGLDPHAEQHGNLGRADFVITYEGHNWIIEVKVSHKDTDDEKLVETASDQIKDKNYSGGYIDPVVLALVISDNTRTIKVWKCRGIRLAAKQEKIKE